MSESNFFGIDLGTTYSCVATLDKYGQPQVIPNREGNSTTPSIVSFLGDNAIAGEDAKNQWRAYPEETVAFIKRHMMQDSSFTNPIFPNHLDPVEISSIILKRIVKDANEYLGREDNPIRDVVITCPAYFDAKAKKRTQQAGEIAGLNVMGIINEPTAAAISYGLKKSKDQTILVYDLGGGTFDVTVLKINGSNYDVIASDGDPRLGGYDWDQCLAKWILNAYNKQYRTRYAFPATEESAASADLKTKKMRASLLNEAERLKKSLCNNARRGNGSAETAWLFEDDGHSLSPTVLTLETFDALTKDLLEQTIKIVHRILKVAREKGVSHIDNWILVGGSSYMPQVKARIDSEFNCKALLSDPNEAVAKGAAIYAAVLASKNPKALKALSDNTLSKAIRITDVCSKTYGIGIINNEVHNFIFANTPLPASFTDQHYTVYENQNGMDLWVYETTKMKSIISKDDAELINKDGLISFLHPVPKGYAVDITMHLDEHGLLSVTASDKEGAHIKFTMSIHGVKSAAQITKSANKIGKLCENL